MELHYRFAAGPDGKAIFEKATATEGSQELLQLVHGPQANLWRVNRKWRRSDQRERKKLEDLGYRVIVIRYDKPLAEQINAHADVFGPGL